MLEEWFNEVNIQSDFFRELNDFLIKLGYQSKRTSSKQLNIEFVKKGKKIAKFSYHPKYGPTLHLKFYASRSYSRYFHERIRETIEEFDFKYTGMIKGAIENVGYVYRYLDGRTYFRFHSEMIDVGMPPLEYISEIKELLKTQDTYWILGGKQIKRCAKAHLFLKYTYDKSA